MERQNDQIAGMAEIELRAARTEGLAARSDLEDHGRGRATPPGPEQLAQASTGPQKTLAIIRESVGVAAFLLRCGERRQQGLPDCWWQRIAAIHTPQQRFSRWCRRGRPWRGILQPPRQWLQRRLKAPRQGLLAKIADQRSQRGDVPAQNQGWLERYPEAMLLRGTLASLAPMTGEAGRRKQVALGSGDGHHGAAILSSINTLLEIRGDFRLRQKGYELCF